MEAPVDEGAAATEPRTFSGRLWRGLCRTGPPVMGGQLLAAAVGSASGFVFGLLQKIRLNQACGCACVPTEIGRWEPGSSRGVSSSQRF